MAWNWKEAGKGAATGAAGGALAGIPGGLFGSGIGSLIGAGAGFIGGGFSGADQSSPLSGSQGSSNGVWEFLFGTPEGQQLLSRFSPEQQSHLSQLLKSGQQDIQNPYAGFEPIKQSILNSLHQDVLPRLTHQFSAQGSNALSSPVLQSQLGGQAANYLADKLGAAQAAYGLQNKDIGLRQIQLGLSPQYGSGGINQNMGTSGLLSEITPSVIKMLTEKAGAYFANNNKSAPQTQQPTSAQTMIPGAQMSTNDQVRSAVSPINTMQFLQKDYSKYATR